MNRLAALSLASLIGASLSLHQALALTLATWLVIMPWSLSMAVVRRHINAPLHLAASVLLVATLVTLLDLALQAWALDTRRELGVYLPLIALQAVLLGLAGNSVKGTLVSLTLFSALLLTLGLLRQGLDMAGLHLATLAPAGFILLGLLLAAHRFFFFSKDSSDR